MKLQSRFRRVMSYDNVEEDLKLHNLKETLGKQIFLIHSR